MERPKAKLDQVGDSATMEVKYVNEVTTKFGTKLVFVGSSGGPEFETPLIPDATADKQLDRLGLNRQSAVGEYLTFSRAPNPSGKPYWNIDVAARESHAPSGRVSSPYQKPSNKQLPFDEEGFPPEPDEADADPYQHLPVHQAGTRVPAADNVAPKAKGLQTLANQYCDLLKYIKAGSGFTDEQAIQSATATVWIAAGGQGLR